jgi:hypothetical protein
MGVISRILNRRSANADEHSSQATDMPIDTLQSLVVLLQSELRLESQELTQALRAFHPSMSQAQCDIVPDVRYDKEGALLGIAWWGNHVVRIVGFDSPMSAVAVEECVAATHYTQGIKQAARAHRSHLLLDYVGNDTSPLEQYVALAAMCGILSHFGAISVLNEDARTMIRPVELSGSSVYGDLIEFLHFAPLLHLYCGFVEHKVEGTGGVWMCTYGAHRLGFPDFAAHAAGHHERGKYFDLFDSILRYLQESGAQLADGDTMQIDEEDYMRFRHASENEDFLRSEGDLLVVEMIRPDEINRPQSKEERRIHHQHFGY